MDVEPVQAAAPAPRCRCARCQDTGWRYRVETPRSGAGDAWVRPAVQFYECPACGNPEQRQMPVLPGS